MPEEAGVVAPDQKQPAEIPVPRQRAALVEAKTAASSQRHEQGPRDQLDGGRRNVAMSELPGGRVRNRGSEVAV